MLPLAAVMFTLRRGLREFVVEAGTQVLTALLEAERTELCGERYRHDAHRRAVRAGHTTGELVMGGRKTRVRRPRVRTADGSEEVPLPSWRQFSVEDPLDREALEKMLVGVSTRKYRRALDALPPEVDEFGTSKSAVSRRFVAATKRQMADVTEHGTYLVDRPMSRTPRHSFPCIHSLYLSREQHAELREQAELKDVTVSELMRAALSDYLSRARKQRARSGDDDEVPPEARNAIAESAHARKLARIRQRAPVLPGMSISSSATIWQPRPGLPAPKQKGPYARREFPMSLDRDGNPVEPPANAVGWRVLIKHYPGGPSSEYRKYGRPLLLDLRVKHHEFAYAVGYQSAAFYLQPIDENGRVLRFHEVYVPLGSAGNWDDD